MPDPVTPVAPVTPAAPTAVAPVTPVTPVAPVTPAAPPASLLDASTTPVTPVVPTDPVAPVVPVTHPEWFYANGVKGEGAPPEWYKAAKYTTLADQAKAYTDLEKRFGSFTGAPKDGKYEFKMPEGIDGELDQASPAFQAFNTWATENQLSQEGYQHILGMYAENMAAMAPNIADIKASMGEHADKRIGDVSAWVKANVDEATQAKFKAATSGANAAEVFEAIEAVIAKTRQVAPPKPGALDPSNTNLTPQAAIAAERAKVGEDGKPLYFDLGPAGQAHRAKVEKMQREFFAAQTS